MFRSSFLHGLLRGSVSLPWIALSSLPAIADGGDLHVTGYSPDVVRRYTGTTGALQGTFAASFSASRELAIHFGSTNNRVLVGHAGGGVEEFDATTGTYVKTYNPGGGMQWAALYGPNGNVLIGDMATDDVREYEPGTGTLVQVLATVLDPADMRIGPNGNLYVCSFTGGYVKEVDTVLGTLVSQWSLPAGSRATDIAFNPVNGEILVADAGLDLVHRYDGGHVLQGSFGASGWGSPTGIVISPWDGDVLVVAGQSDQVHSFEPVSYSELLPFLAPGPGTDIADAEFRNLGECEISPGQCCAGRPSFEAPGYAGFGPLVSVGTASPDAEGDAVVAVFDLGNPSAGPFNTSYPTQIYSDPSWSQSNLGSVFGVALDAAGNVYVSSTTCYSTDAVGLLGGSGTVYKLDTLTSAVTVFATIPNSGPGLGNLCYDCEHDQFFVSSLDDGRIYRVDSAGAIQNSFDFGAADEPTNVFAPLGDRIWAVQKHDGRLYFSVWWEDEGNQSVARSNEIWSVALDGAGDFTGAARLEISIPPYPGFVHSNPISDMRFTPAGRLLAAERGMTSATDPTPHRAKLLEFECAEGVWIEGPHTFGIGVGAQENSAGGVDVDHRPCGRVYVTGDALQLGPQDIYGTQGLPRTGGSVLDSILVDFNGDLTVYDKTYIGDVAVPCLAGSACPPLTAFCDPGHLLVAPCPCGNPPIGVLHGCDNSHGTGGAVLDATGLPSLANDTLVFATSGELATATTILLQGTTQIASGTVFGQGIRCIGGSLKRLYVKAASAGSITAPSGGDASVSTRSAMLGDVIPPGGTRYYMAYYRDPVVLGGCPVSSTFNATGGGIVVWDP